jgi:small-conductance mechanosensitive channel
MRLAFRGGTLDAPAMPPLLSWGPIAQVRPDPLRSVWETPFLEGLTITPGAVLRALLIVLVAWLISSLLTRALRISAIRREIDPGVRYSLARLLQLAILIVGGLMSLNALGVGIGTLAVAGGALGLGIGFGLQGIAANFVAGLVLLFERPIRVGDRVTIGIAEQDPLGPVNGFVQAIRLRATTVVTPDNITLIVPNQELVTRTVVNWSLGDLRMRIRFSIKVAYDSDLERVSRIMSEIAQAHSDTLKDPPAEIRLIEAADSGLVYQLLVWIGDPRRRGRVESDLRLALVKRFRAEGIVIPFPRTEVQVLSGELRATSEESRRTDSPPE